DVPGFPGGRLEGRLGALARPVVRRTLAGAAAVAPNSEVLRALAVDFMPAVAAKTVVIENGVDPAAIAAAPAESGGPELALVCVGQLIERKRVDLAIDAVHHLASAGVPVKLTVVGNGPLRAALARRARSLGLAGAVGFTGRLPRGEVRAVLAAADVFVM